MNDPLKNYYFVLLAEVSLFTLEKIEATFFSVAKISRYCLKLMQ